VWGDGSRQVDVLPRWAGAVWHAPTQVQSISHR
jgi:hypothetical protein